MPERPNPLTLRQFEVLRLRSQCLATKDIAARLGIGTSTAQSHLRQMRLTLGTRWDMKAISIALRQGWLEEEEVESTVLSYIEAKGLLK